MPPTKPTIQRGDIWQVRFDPSEGDEIQKTRPPVVVSVRKAGIMDLRIVVPITNWQEQFDRYFWMTPLEPSSKNGLGKKSAADTFQVKSVSTLRFEKKIGQVTTDEMEEISTAIAICIGYAT